MSKVIVPCDTCGKPVTKWPALVKLHNFCSDTCYRSYRRTLIGNRSAAWKGGPIVKQCEWCGKDFAVVRAASDQRFCSLACKYVSGRKPGHCIVCGKEFRPTHPGRKYCSYACFQTQPRQPCSPETKAKDSLAHRGKPGLSGASNPMFKNGWSATEMKVCPHCGKPFRAPAHRICCSRKCSYAMQGERLHRFYSETPAGQALVARYREDMKALGNQDWGHEEYAPGFTGSLKRRVLYRDGHRCRLCGAERIAPGWLAIHHVDGSKIDHQISNLVTLCKPCHMRVHQNGLDVSGLVPS